MPRKKQVRQQNIKYDNQNTKYANQNTKYANQKFTLFCREAIFVANLRTFLAYFLQAKKYGGVPKRTNIRYVCKPHTYSHPFLPTLVSYKIIWPIYGFVHFPVTEKRAKLGSNLKQLISENFRFPSPNYDFFLLNTSHTEDMRRKNPN